MPRLIWLALAPAVMFFRPSVEDRFGVDGGGGGAVARVLGGLGGDFLNHLGADVLDSESSISISLATVTPSLVTVGEPKDFSRMTTRPEGPRVVLTALESFWTPRRMAWRASLSKMSCLADISISSFAWVCCLLSPRPCGRALSVCVANGRVRVPILAVMK